MLTSASVKGRGHRSDGARRKANPRRSRPDRPSPPRHYRLAQFARLLPNEDLVELLRGQQRSVSVERVVRSEAPVVVGDKLWCEGVRCLDARDPLQSELLDESVLQRRVGALDAALGGGRVGANDVDV